MLRVCCIYFERNKKNPNNTYCKSWKTSPGSIVDKSNLSLSYSSSTVRDIPLGISTLEAGCCCSTLGSCFSALGSVDAIAENVEEEEKREVKRKGKKGRKRERNVCGYHLQFYKAWSLCTFFFFFSLSAMARDTIFFI